MPQQLNTEQNCGSSLIPAPAATVLGIPIWGLRLEEFVELARQLIKQNRKALFTTIGAPSIVASQKSSEFFNHFQHADVVLPDGMLPMLAARALGYKVPQRVPGPDFVDLFLPVAAEEGFKIFFMGTTEDTLKKLKSNCLRRYPNLNIVGTLAPPFGDFDEAINQRLVDNINRSCTDVLFVGMTAPKQELWLSRHFEQLEVQFAMGIGAAFDYLAQNKPRAPKWLGQLGLEWLYRLVHEPRRLWRRNITNNIAFFWLLGKRYAKNIFHG